MSSCAAAVRQSGPLRFGEGEGAGVGGEAGAEGRVLPGMTFGFEGIGIGMACVGEGIGRVCRGAKMWVVLGLPWIHVMLSCVLSTLPTFASFSFATGTRYVSP